MANGYQYVLELVDKMSGPAKTVQQQVVSLTSKLSEEAEEVRKLEAEYKKLTAAQDHDAESAKKLQKQIGAKRDAMGGTADKIRGLVKGEQQAAASAAQAAEASGGLNGALMALGPYAAAAAAALMVLGGAVVAFVAWGAKLALEAAAFKRQTMAALQSATGTAEAAGEAFKIIRKASDEIGISEARAQKIGLALLDAGVVQAELGDTLKSIALLEKVRGEQVAGKLEELIKKSAASGKFKLEGESLVGTGLKQADVVAELAKRMKKSTAEVEAAIKAGTVEAKDGIAAMNAVLSKQLGGGAKGLQSLDGAMGKFQEKISRLFEDVNVAPFLELIKDVSDLFDTSTVSGTALKWLATTIFDGLFATAKAAFPYIKTAILEVVIVALKLYIAAKPIVATLKELWGTAAQGEATHSVIKTVVDLVVGLAGAVLLAAGYWLVFASYAIQVWSAIFGALSTAYSFVTGVFQSIWDFLGKLFTAEGAMQIATSLIDGLVSGITGGAGRVVEALTGVGKNAISAVKGVLGIASPSKVMAEMGGYTAEGFARGVDDGAGKAQGALEAAVAPPTPAAPANSGGGGAAVSITIAEGAVLVQAGNANASELAELLPAKLVEALEAFAMQMGGATAPSGG